MKESQERAHDERKRTYCAIVAQYEIRMISNHTRLYISIEKEGVWHPITFSSHSMMPQEWNYPIADKEMLSVIQALEQWCHYLEDARHQSEIWNDHANLQWFMQRQDLNQ